MEIIDIEKIEDQYKTGLSILTLSKLYNIPYATLHRALKKDGNKTKETGIK